MTVPRLPPPDVRSRRRPPPAGWLGVLLALCVVARLPAPDARAAGGAEAAATENELATREALRQLRAGGNAVDAAVTAALVAGVASPSSSGLGGGGFALVWLAAEKRPVCLDFREAAPAELDAESFERRPFAWEERGRYVGVPGEARGLHELHRRFGKRAWRDVVRPAVEVARAGFPVNRHLGRAITGSADRLARDPGLARVFLPGGKPAAVGALLRRETLARTLEQLAAGGPAALYEGATGAELVRAARALGSPLTAADLAEYRVVERSPIRARFAGHEVWTMPPPSAGGLMVAQALGLWSPEELRRLPAGSAGWIHALAESFRGSLADRMRFIGDPDHQPIELERLLDSGRLAERRRRIAPDRTHALPRFGLEEHGTHHLVTADAEGNFVALTTTVNRAFGAQIAVEAHDLILNDELDDFTPRAAVAPFGLTESPNRPRGRARPVSSMTPTLVVRDGAVVLALGGSGGMTIATNVAQLLLQRLVHGTAPVQLVAGPRFYLSPQGTLLLDDARPALVEDLRGRGELVAPMTFTQSAVQLVAVVDGRKVPAADPRKFGSARAR